MRIDVIVFFFFNICTIIFLDTCTVQEIVLCAVYACRMIHSFEHICIEFSSVKHAIYDKVV